MRTLIATDLDRTLIYSGRARRLGPDVAATVCVERHDGAPSAFMTAAAAGLLARLAAREPVVPVTTRTEEQYRRVRLPGPPPRYAVVANGGVLLVDGEPDRAWSQRVAAALADTVPLGEVWEQLAHVCRPEFTAALRNAAGLFCYAVVRPARLPAGFVTDLAGWAAERGWRTSLQGRKLYWVPERLTKSAAVAEVAARAAAGRVLAAGDSLLDVDLLLAAERGVHPRHGELHEQGWSAPTVSCTAAAGLLAGEEVVRWFAARTMAPDGAAPDGAAPDGAAPDGAAPDGAAPDGAAPDGAAPDGAAPDGAAPDGAAPAGPAGLSHGDNGPWRAGVRPAGSNPSAGDEGGQHREGSPGP